VSPGRLLFTAGYLLVWPALVLFLAGDWTDTGWPATMEGAVRSGYLAAEAVLRREGRPHQLVRPDLGADGLVALWARS